MASTAFKWLQVKGIRKTKSNFTKEVKQIKSLMMAIIKKVIKSVEIQ